MDESALRRAFGLPPLKRRLVSVDVLLSYEGDEPALAYRFSLSQLLSNSLTDEQRHAIGSDLRTIEYWVGVYSPFRGREHDLFDVNGATIKIWEPMIDDHVIFDGFHRLAAAKLAGLDVIAAHAASRHI